MSRTNDDRDDWGCAAKHRSRKLRRAKVVGSCCHCSCTNQNTDHFSCKSTDHQTYFGSTGLSGLVTSIYFTNFIVVLPIVDQIEGSLYRNHCYANYGGDDGTKQYELNRSSESSDTRLWTWYVPCHYGVRSMFWEISLFTGFKRRWHTVH